MPVPDGVAVLQVHNDILAQKEVQTQGIGIKDVGFYKLQPEGSERFWMVLVQSRSVTLACIRPNSRAFVKMMLRRWRCTS